MVYCQIVLSNVNADMKVITEETIGPVASVVSRDDFESALQQVNDAKLGLQEYLYE